MKETKFKQTDIGLVPEEWEVTTLGVACHMPTDTIDTNMFDHQLYITTENLLQNCQGTVPYNEPLTYKKVREYRDGDVLVSNIRPNLRKTYYATQTGGCSTDVIVFRAKEGLNSRILHCVVNDYRYGATVAAEAVGTKMPRGDKNTIREYAFAIPPLPEQQRIAEVLGSVDTLLSRLDKLIAKKQAMKRGAMQQLLTGKTRLKGFTEPWEEKTLGEVFISIGNNTFSREMLCASGKVQNVHYGDVLIKYGEIIDVSQKVLPYINKDIRSKAKYTLQNGDIIMADTAEDELVGKACEIVGISSVEVEPGLHTIALRPQIPFAIGYLGYYINTAYFHNQLLPYIQGTKVFSLTKNNIENTIILYPPTIAEQRAIARILSRMDKEIAVMQAEREKTERIKTGMMQQLLTGKIRLTT